MLEKSISAVHALSGLLAQSIELATKRSKALSDLSARA